MAELPMFPLGTVLFPTLYLPLHVFEPRYRALVQHCLATEPEFGVVLIERGWEVGGGDVRTTVGTVARIVQVGETDDGRYALGTVGTRRIRVVRWLPDAPYPLAEVEDLDDDPPTDDGRTAAAAIDALLPALRRMHGMRAELGEPAVPLDRFDRVDPEADAVVVSYQLAALSGLGPADAQQLLAASGPDERLVLLTALVETQLDVLAFRLQEG